ncbi:hypothetical protein BT93_C1990 [Corymbia citriodora subsp. variegata]|nr:hypothetical protein BT93_C1990 [Corymbia citriodora subsp. variegata]
MPVAKVDEKYRPLFEAMVKADWANVKTILNKDEAMMANVVVGKESVNALEYAVMAAQDQCHLVENLIDCLPPKSDEYKYSILRSALYDAARRGRIMTVKVLLKSVVSKSDIVPLALSHAVTYSPMQKEVIWYLARQTTSSPDFNTMSCLILAGHLGIVLDSAYRGILEIVEFCLDQFPELMWDHEFPRKLMKEVVRGRQVELFRVVNAYDRAPNLNEDTMYHDLMEEVVEWRPECVPANVPGAAVLMQREYQWFKVLEERSDPSLKSLKFEVVEEKSGHSFDTLKLEKTEERKGKTYWELFVEKRKDLLKEAGQWIKDTSSSCSLVATLIITIAFTAALTVPGGNDSSTGIPILMRKGSFMIFAVADALALALFSSVIATLIFLGIVTPCYTVEDILHSLPRKMIIGVTFLVLSLAFMLVAFGSALTIVLSKRLKWISIPITLLAAVPIYFFLNVQFPLYVEMFESIYWPRLYSPLKLRKKSGRNFNFRIFWTKAS